MWSQWQTGRVALPLSSVYNDVHFTTPLSSCVVNNATLKSSCVVLFFYMSLYSNRVRLLVYAPEEIRREENVNEMVKVTITQGWYHSRRTFHNDQIAQGWYHTRITSCKSSVLIGTAMATGFHFL